MAEPPTLLILDECKSLLSELDRVERHMSELAGKMASASNDQGEGEINRIGGLIDAHFAAERDFAGLRLRIVELARTYALCPQGVPDEGYSPSGLRDLLQNIQRMEQGFKQPAPESLDSPWERIPSDVLASIETPEGDLAGISAGLPSSGPEVIPSDVERFLERVISEANHAVLAEKKLPDGITSISFPVTSVSQQHQISARQRQDSGRPQQDSAQPRQISERQREITARRKTPAPASSPPAPAPESRRVEQAPPPSQLPSHTAVPSAVVEAASVAEQKAVLDSAASDSKPVNSASERDYQELLAFGEGKLKLGRPEFADLLANLALLNHKQGRLADAEELHRKELAIRENELGSDHPKVATSLNNLALLCRDLGKHQEARRLWERSLAIVENAFGSDHPKVALRLGNLADLLCASGQKEQAEPYYQRLMALQDSDSAGGRREVKSSLRRYADLLRATRRKKEAGRVEARIATPRPGWFRK